MHTPAIHEENRRWWVLAAMTGSLAMVMLDQTVVGVALPSMREDLGLTTTGVQWVINAYVLALAAVVALMGRVTDHVGRVTGFAAGVTVFALASAACGLAGSETAIIVARAIQGLGAAAMMTTSAPIVIEAFALRERGRAMAVYSTIPIAFVSIGPLIGGVLTEYASWRYVFWINLPVAIIALVLTRVARPNNARFRTGHFDVPGAALLVTGLVAFVLGLQQGSVWGWGSPATIAAIVGGLVLLALFVRVELRARAPVVELRLFAGRAFWSDNVILFCVQVAMIASTTFTAIYLQTVLGFSPVEAGLALLPLILPILIVKGYVGRLFDRVGVQRPARIGTTAVAISFFLLAPAIALESFPLMLPGLVIQGFGIAFVMSPTNTDALSRAPAELRGSASGTVNTSRQLGGTIGLAAIGTVIATVEASELASGSSFADATATATAIGFLVAAGAMVVGAVIAWLATPAGRQEDDAPAPAKPPADSAPTPTAAG